MNWSSKSLGSSLQHAVFRLLVRCKLMPLARGLLAVVVGYYTLLPRIRGRSRAYIARRFASHSGLSGWLHTWRLYKSFGNILLERTVAGVTGRFALIDSPEHMQHFVRALAEGKGCIALSGHVGAWQTGTAGLEELGVPLRLLLYKDPGDVDPHYFEQASGHQVSVINAAGPFGGAVDCAAALRRGEVVCVMGDRLRTSKDPFLEVDFMGGVVRFPISPYILASITGAPLVITFALRDSHGIRGLCCGVLHVPEGLRKNPQQALPFLQAYVAALETVVAEYPYQFFNFFDMWTYHDTLGND